MRVASLVVAGVCASTTLAAPPPDYGLSWKTIGDPGNRPVNKQEAPDYFFPGAPPPPGQVDYTYRLSNTEVTNGQWLEFVQAYLPHYEGSGSSDLAFGGQWIVFGVSGGKVNGAALEGAAVANWPANMSWEYAARYVNWLHNDKGTDLEDFETGVYDTSTFVQDENGNWLHQPERSPGAKFWIPSLSEWTKAAYWDPEKDGGEGGYWQYPNGTDSPLTPGKPEDGGETNAGNSVPYGSAYWNVGTYPDSQSPWGLLDMSGGETEWLEDANPLFLQSRLIKGSDFGLSDPVDDDQLDAISPKSAFFPLTGLRVASTIPSPATAFVVVSPLLFPTLTRRRR